MFTVKILNYTAIIEQDGHASPTDYSPKLESVYLREWGSLEVWLPDSQNYKDKVEELKQQVYNDHHSDIDEPEMSADDLNALIDLQGTYKAFITYESSSGEDSFYCIAENEEVYVTDSNGNTVYSIR